MATTIQVRVDDKLKESTDVLFKSLGLDTSTAIRMFLVASMEAGGIPFAIRRESPEERALRLHAAEIYRESGGYFLTKEESLANMRAAIARGKASRAQSEESVADEA